MHGEFAAKNFKVNHNEYIQKNRRKFKKNR